jgi:hypothetical protein
MHAALPKARGPIPLVIPGLGEAERPESMNTGLRKWIPGLARRAIPESQGGYSRSLCSTIFQNVFLWMILSPWNV